MPRRLSLLARRPRFWLLLTGLIAWSYALVPLFAVPRFYFLGDTQVGAYGHWYQLGDKLRSGEWPVIDLVAWQGGNYISEGQWGLFSPLTMLIALLATVAGQVVIFVTVIKFILIITGAVGTHLLARSYGVVPALACVTGVAVTLGGASQYLDAPEWVTSQMIWALLPWAWWGLRRTMIDNANPFPAVVFGMLVVTVGYVYGTIYLVVVVGACLLDAALARNVRGLLRVLGVGICWGLVAVAVYLPGVLSAPATTRGSTIESDGRLQGDLPGLVGSMIPTVLSPSSPALPGVRYPAHYIAWFWPVLLWLDPWRVRPALRSAAGLLVAGTLAVLWVLGPNAVGPLRWPIRVMPFLTLVVVLLAVHLVNRALARRPSGARLLATVALIGFAGWLIVARFWTDRQMTVVSAGTVLVGLVGLWLLIRLRQRMTAVLAVLVWCGVLLVQQHVFYPWPTAVDRQMPSTLAGYRSQLSTAQGDAILVGNPEKTVLAHPISTADFLIASSWYVNPHRIQNTYSTIGFTPYTARYQIRFDGATYPYLIDELFTTESETGRQRVDLLSVSTILFTRLEQTDSVVLNPPAGWHVSSTTPYAVTWVRDAPLPTAGGVVWSSAGLRVQTRAVSTREVRLQVQNSAATTGRIALSRLAWPGYHVSGAGSSLGTSVDEYLTTIEIPAGASGDVVLRYDPPGWNLERGSLIVGVGVGLVWSVALMIVRRRRMQRRRVDQPG